MGGREAVPGCPDHDNLAVRLNRNAIGLVVIPEEVRGLFSAGAKARVQASIGVVLGQREITGAERAVMMGHPGQDNLSIGLKSQAGGRIIVAEEVSGLDSAIAKCRIEIAGRLRAFVSGGACSLSCGGWQHRKAVWPDQDQRQD